MISHHHNDPLIEHFGIDKIRELIGQKYNWLSMKRDVKWYVRGYDVCLTSKIVCHKPYRDRQSLPIPTHRCKDLSIDFMTKLPLSSNWKGDSSDSILVIVNRLTKMVHYKQVKVSINSPRLGKDILNVVVRYHDLPGSIVTNKGLLFTSKFWSLLCYFLGVK